MTLEQFSNKVGVAKTTISRIENGITNVTEQMRRSICREVRVDPIWLTTGDGK
ncbi:MAG: helix-turn-helix domain-containing protein [Lachnospiraceae bacterium]|nr:helix-turn-helix domain-containing protein [Lachnospiraceae bacterium]